MVNKFKILLDADCPVIRLNIDDKFGESKMCGVLSDTFKCICVNCGALVTYNNVDRTECEYCECCEYCGPEKCPYCGDHLHCGDCV